MSLFNWFQKVFQSKDLSESDEKEEPPTQDDSELAVDVAKQCAKQLNRLESMGCPICHHTRHQMGSYYLKVSASNDSNASPLMSKHYWNLVYASCKKCGYVSIFDPNALQKMKPNVCTEE